MFHPPKKKGAGKFVKKKSSTVDPKPSTEDDILKKQLEKQIIRLREELDREKKERNYVQLERDKIQGFWEISKSHLKEKKAEIRNRDKEVEESGEKHQQEIRKYEEKVKHLLFEHENSTVECKREGEVATKLLEKERADLESELQRDIHSLKVDSKEQEHPYKKSFRSLKLSHDKEITKLRSEFEEKLREIKSMYEKKLEKHQEEQELRRKTEIHEIEQRLSLHIYTLIKNHDKAFNDLKNYYNDLTEERVSQINSMKEEVAEKNTKGKTLEKEKLTVLQQNNGLTELLQKATQEVSVLQIQLTDYQKNKILLAATKARLKVTKNKLKDLKIEQELLQQRFSKARQDHDELYKKFDKAILEVQQRSSIKNLLQERKLVAQTDTGE